MAERPKSNDFRRGVRACIEWLHEEARNMNDPHAKSILNNAAFHIGQNKPTDAPSIASLQSQVARLKEALEPFAHYYDLNDLHERDNDDAIEVPVRDLRRARTALKETTDGN